MFGSKRRMARLTMPERVEAAEKAQRLHEWIICGVIVFALVWSMSYLPDAYDLVHQGCNH